MSDEWRFRLPLGGRVYSQPGDPVVRVRGDLPQHAARRLAFAYFRIAFHWVRAEPWQMDCIEEADAMAFAASVMGRTVSEVGTFRDNVMPRYVQRAPSSVLRCSAGARGEPEPGGSTDGATG